MAQSATSAILIGLVQLNFCQLERAGMFVAVKSKCYHHHHVTIAYHKFHLYDNFNQRATFRAQNKWSYYIIIQLFFILVASFSVKIGKQT